MSKLNELRNRLENLVNNDIDLQDVIDEALSVANDELQMQRQGMEINVKDISVDQRGQKDEAVGLFSFRKDDASGEFKVKVFESRGRNGEKGLQIRVQDENGHSLSGEFLESYNRSQLVMSIVNSLSSGLLQVDFVTG